MTDATDPSTRSPAPLIAVAFVVVLGGIGTCAAYVLAPRGERVGTVDLLAPTPVTLDLAARSTLSFRLDATLPAPRNEPSGRAKRNAVYDTLGESGLVLTLAREGARPLEARCAAYDGRFVSAGDNGDEVTVEGIPLTCAFDDVNPGRVVVTLTAVRWARGVRARRASLEVRAASR